MAKNSYLKWKRQSLAFLAGTTLAMTGINYCPASSQAAPTPEATPAAATKKPASIAQTIESLKQSKQRWIEVNLQKQRLYAWEGDALVYQATISSGKRSTPTLKGVFAVQTKLKSTRMRGADYDVPNVPYTMYYDGGYAIHGAYWHNNFGTPVSHGCVNLPPKKALWVFNWASVGTPVVVR